MVMKKGILGLALVLITALAIASIDSAMAAGEYPTKPISVIVPYSPGGGSDMNLRPLIAVAPAYIKEPLITRFKPGASGVIGVSHLVKAKPDGYTIGITSTTPTLIRPHTVECPYALKDIQPISQVAAMPTFLVGSIGGTYHMAMLRLQAAAGIKLKIVPFQGGGPAAVSLLGGHTDSDADAYGLLTGHIKAGTVRALAVMSGERDARLPDVPTLKEQGYDIEAAVFYGIIGPVGIPEPILTKLETAFKQMTEDRSYKAIVKKMELATRYRNRAEFTKYLQKEDKIMLDLLTKMGKAKKK
jgi:tripartite-type tricarboxylate transporter receptor subunit TctC